MVLKPSKVIGKIPATDFTYLVILQPGNMKLYKNWTPSEVFVKCFAKFSSSEGLPEFGGTPIN